MNQSSPPDIDSTLDPAPARRAGRARLFAIAVGVCVIAAGAVVAGAVMLGGKPVPADAPEQIDALRAAPHVFVRQTVGSSAAGRVAVVPWSNRATRALTGLDCERFYFAANRGVCLTAGSGFFGTHRALLLDEDLNTLATVPLTGIPSRARISPDGRYAATTVFVSGHSYAGGGFSTQTQILDATTGAVLGDLEQFSLTRDGVPMTSVDINYWGVTFTADSNVFYATVGTDGQRYLVRGNVAARTLQVLAENVECPSLSPDGTRIAYKRRVRSNEAIALFGRPFLWQIHVMRLDDLSATPLGESRDIDDQVEWLDDESVLYGYDEPDGGATNVWRAPVDGSAPELFIENAESPSALRLPSLPKAL